MWVSVVKTQNIRNACKLYHSFVVQQPNWGLGRLIVEIARSHAYSPGILPLNESSARRSARYLHDAQQKQDTESMPLAGFETAISGIKLLQIYTLDFTATYIVLPVI